MRRSRFEYGGEGDDRKLDESDVWNAEYVCIADFIKMKTTATLSRMKRRHTSKTGVVNGFLIGDD